MDDQKRLIDYALAYHEVGLNVVPLHSVKDGRCSCGAASCGKPGKHPRVRWRDLRSKPLDASQIRQMWTTWPESNIGVITGSTSGVVVLDLDGPEGVASMEAAGLPIQDLPPTPTVKTGGGGYHFYFRMPDDVKSVKTLAGILPNVDIRAEGGLAVLPPSNHASGTPYAWVKGRDIGLDFADFDFTLLSGEKREPVDKARERWFERALAGVGSGGRNDMAARLAGRYFGFGLQETEVFLLLRGWNAHNDPPLPLEELRRTVESIRQAEQDDDEDATADILQTVSDVLRIKLVAVKRITGDDPKVVLEFNEGTATLTTSQLLSPKSFQQAVAEATKVVVRKLGTRTVPTHDRLAQMILSASEDIDAGDEATGSGELMLMVTDYLESFSTLPDADDGVAPLRGPFTADGKVWFSAVDLVQRAAQRWGTRPSLASTAQMMKQIGMVRRMFETVGGGTKAMWGISADRVPSVRSADAADPNRPDLRGAAHAPS